VLPEMPSVVIVMLSITTEKRLADLIGAVAENERELERKRRELLDDPFFAPSACFARLDQLSTGYLTTSDIKSFLYDWGIVVSNGEVTRLIELSTGFSPLRLYKSDLMDLILPNDYALRSVGLRRDLYPPVPLGKSAEFLLARVLQAAIEGNERLEHFRSSLKTCYDYNDFDAFRTIDRYRIGYLSFRDVNLFLGRVGRNDDADYFIKALDRDNDGRLSYIEFQKGVTPYFTSVPDKYSYSERKPLQREFSFDREVPRTEYKERRVWSEERPIDFSRSSYVERTSPLNSYRKVYETPLKKSAMSNSFVTAYTTPSKTYQFPMVKKLEYSASPSRQTEVTLALVMEKQLSYEKKIERVKEELVLQSDFNLMEGFRFFDHSSKGYATMNDFYEGMKSLGILGSYEDVSLLFKRMDNNKDGRIRYSDYYLTFAPRKELYEKLLMERSPYKPIPSIGFSSMTKIIYKELLDLLIEYEQSFDITKQRLRKDINFDAYEAFKEIDIKDKGYITLRLVLLNITK
jgi:Ca2+-binding EF-hand superfamily protein